jgi:hypothetical protein
MAHWAGCLSHCQDGWPAHTTCALVRVTAHSAAQWRAHRWSGGGSVNAVSASGAGSSRWARRGWRSPTEEAALRGGGDGGSARWHPTEEAAPVDGALRNSVWLRRAPCFEEEGGGEEGRSQLRVEGLGAALIGGGGWRCGLDEIRRGGRVLVPGNWLNELSGVRGYIWFFGGVLKLEEWGTRRKGRRWQRGVGWGVQSSGRARGRRGRAAVCPMWQFGSRGEGGVWSGWTAAGSLPWAGPSAQCRF